MLNIILDPRKVRHYLLQLKENTLPSLKIIPQPSDQTCWAACYKMIDQWEKKTNSWCYYINLATGACRTCSLPIGRCNEPRMVSAILNDWHALGYKETIHKSQGLNLNEIRTCIKERKPIQAFLRYKNKLIGHFVLIIGTSRTKKSIDNTLIILDPLKNQVEQKELTDFFVNYHWQDSWIVAK